MYGKSFAQMYTGSMVGSGPVVFAVWGYIISNMHLPQAQPALKVPGVASIELNPILLATILGTTPEEVQGAIDYLCAPDPRSRNEDEEGRRMVREGQFLYRIVNALKYNAIRDEVARKEYMRDYMRPYMRAKRASVKSLTSLTLEGVKPGLASLAHTDTDTDKNSLTHSPTGEGEGFGMVTPKTPPNKFDIAHGGLLEAAIRKLPPRVTGILNAKPSTWADHIRRLRVVDRIPEKDISRVMKWYTEHIGEEYTPRAYSGETFRKKWPKLLAAAARDKTAVAEITPVARDVAARVTMAGWPKGSAKAIPGACQACLTAYGAWRRRVKTFVVLLEREDTVEEYDPKRVKRFIEFGKHILAVAPAGVPFVEMWMRDVNKRVANWPAWSGDLSPFLFKSNADGFNALGRGWAAERGAGAGLWDRFMETMNKEVVE